MKCYVCGARLGSSGRCPACGSNVRIYKKIIYAANAYYNSALAKASVRDLSGAACDLTMSLRMYKQGIDARNLLGLVYFEMGETVKALTEWVISRSYQPIDNAASRYLKEIQDDPARLETINQTIKKYNQALAYCQQDSRDLAIIQLKKVLSLNPHLISAHQLLALLYIQEGKYDQAKKTLRLAGKIDTNNTLTLRYLKEANAGIREANPTKKQKREDQVSYQSGNETIIQPRYLKDNTAITTVVNLVIGLVIGAAVTCFLIVPGVKREVQDEAQTEVLAANSETSNLNQTISSLEEQVEELTERAEGSEAEAETAAGRLTSYEQLMEAYGDYLAGDIEGAGDALSNVNQEYLNSQAQSLYDTVTLEVNAEYAATLYQEGYEAYAAGDFETAISDLAIVVDMDEEYENGNALYYLAQSYRRNDDLDTAKVYYQKFVELYPGTQRASVAQGFLN